MIRVSQICYGKWLADAGFSETNLGNLDRIRHDQGLAEGRFSVTNLGKLEGRFSVTNLGKLDRIRHDGEGGRSVWPKATYGGRRPPSSRSERARPAGA